MLMVIGNFNAKAGSKYPQYKDEIGKYGKELKNSNGDTLLQLAKEKKLILTNILFSHKLALQTIPSQWHHPQESLQKSGRLHDNKTNPQKTDHKCKIIIRFSTSTDHKTRCHKH